LGKPNARRDSRALVRALACGVGRNPAMARTDRTRQHPKTGLTSGLPRLRKRPCGALAARDIEDRFSELVGVTRAFGGHSSRRLRASKLSAALWSKTSARCLAFSSDHTSTVDSVPSGSIRTTCHPKDLASYHSRFILRICAQTSRFSGPERYNQTDPLPRWGSSRCAPPGIARPRRS